MLPQEIIRKKRDGAALTVEEIDFIVRGLTDGSVTEGQAAAFAMAVLFRGMEVAERIALTLAMRSPKLSRRKFAPPSLTAPTRSTWFFPIGS